MNNKQIIKQLKKESRLFTPNNLDSLKAKLKIPNNNKLSSFYKQTLFKKYIVPGLSVCLLITGVALTISSQVSLNKITAVETELTNYSYVTMSAAPSVEIVVDNNTLKTTSIRGLNKDGVLVVFDEEINDVSLEETVSTLVSIISDCGYIQQDSTISYETIALNSEIQESISNVVLENIENTLQDKNIEEVEIVEPEIPTRVFKTAEKYNVSPYKLNLINKITEDGFYSLESLINKSVADLNNLAYGINEETIELYVQEVDEKYSEFISNEVTSKDIINDSIDFYNQACNLFLSIEIYAKNHHINVKPPISGKDDHFTFNKPNFDWRHFMECGEGNKSPVYENTKDYYDSLTYLDIYKLIDSFLNTSNENQISILNNVDCFQDIDASTYNTISPNANELCILQTALIFFKDVAFPNYFKEVIGEYKPDLQNEFKKGYGHHH